jgi:CheY-like chemotaxis protein
LDHEHAGSISTRKLVIETAKLNVITAYSSREAIATLQIFPNVRGVVMDAGRRDMPCDELIAQLKAIRSDIPVIVVDHPGAASCDSADHFLPSFEPKRLLDLLQTLNPAETEMIERRNKELAAEED